MGKILGMCLVWVAMVVAQLQGFRGCVEEERVGLLALSPMKGVNTSSDCCAWVGVNCSATSGRVEILSLFELRNNGSLFKLRNYNNKHLGSHRNDESLGSFLNISLFLPFQELLVLDLSFCDIRGLLQQADFCKMNNIIKLNLGHNSITGPFPDCVGNMTKLQYLYIESNMLSGNFYDFVNMRSLKYLDISRNRLNINLQDFCKLNNIINLNLGYNSITGPLPDCVGNMTKLQRLEIDYNMLSGNIPPTIGNLSDLGVLSLEGNYFEGSFSLRSLANNSQLYFLSLSGHDNNLQLETEIPTWFPSFQLKGLRLRNLTLNRMSNSVIPSFLLHQYDLGFVDLSHNQLEGSFPSWLLQNNSDLGDLRLSGNFLMGNLILPDFIHLLSVLEISSNKIDGKLPDGIGLLLPRLTVFNISRNRCEGTLPSSLGTLQGLSTVDFSFNSFSGELQENMFARSRGMMMINLSNNLFHGKMSLNLTNLASMRILLLNNNRFSGTIEDWTLGVGAEAISQLLVLDISNNMISGRLPSWITQSINLKVLKVSNNYLEGDILVELCNMELFYLDISRNKFSGSVPSCFSNSSLKALSLRDNNLSGAIPEEFLNNSNLIALDLSYNNFSNLILPNWIYSLKNIQILLMAGMQLEGEISMQLCKLENIKILDLSHNNFNGSIPSCLFEMPFWVTDTQDLGFVSIMDTAILSSNNFFMLAYPIFITNFQAIAGYEAEFTTKGVSHSYQNNLLNYMTGLDVSNNKLSGQIPTQIEYSQAIRSLNLSNNQLWGSIPSSISKMRLIESLDLSSNNLSGEIPYEIANLNFISIFNVSNNNLSGPTPNRGQFANFDERNYGGNEYLCGPLLHRDCTSPVPSTPSDEQGEYETGLEMASFWWTFVASYIFVVVFWAIVLGIKPRWCGGLSRMIDVFSLKLYSIITKL